LTKKCSKKFLRLDDPILGTIIKVENIEYLHGCFGRIFTFLAQDLVSAKKFCEQFNIKYNQYVVDIELLEGILIIRKQSVRNPRLKKQIQYLYTLSQTKNQRNSKFFCPNRAEGNL
jgi:hypothetical protein